MAAHAAGPFISNGRRGKPEPAERQNCLPLPQQLPFLPPCVGENFSPLPRHWWLDSPCPSYTHFPGYFAAGGNPGSQQTPAAPVPSPERTSRVVRSQVHAPGSPRPFPRVGERRQRKQLRDGGCAGGDADLPACDRESGGAEQPPAHPPGFGKTRERNERL